MKQNFKNLTLTCLLASTVLMSCQNPSSDKEKIIDRVYVTADDSMSSEELSTAAEQLVGPYTFMLAYKTALKAVEKDPTNMKAQFYVSFLKRFETFRGVFVRIKPALKPEQLNNLNDTIKKFPESPLKAFLLEPGTPIKTVTDLQDVLSDYVSALKEFRLFLKKNQSADLNIYLNPHVFEQAIKSEMENSCTVVDKNGTLTVDCDYSHVATKKLNSADMIALAQMEAGEVLLYGLYNNYSLEGIDKLAEADKKTKMSNREKVNFLNALPNFGKLRKNNTFEILTSIGSDFSAATKWALSYQKDLCPKGLGAKDQRKGFLFNNGLCIEDTNELERNLALLDSALSGIIQIDIKTKSGDIINSNLNAFVWNKNPISDLRQIKPSTWNKCDQATSLVDNTLGGLLVDNNANLFLDTNCNK